MYSALAIPSFANFKPNKERDYLHQDKSNEELKIDVDDNEKLLALGFDLVLENIKKDTNISFLDIVKIEFKDDDSDFYIKLKSNYIDEIMHLEKVVVDNEN